METVNVTYLGSNAQYQEYSNSDLALVNKSFITPSFGGPTDYIELFIKDEKNTISFFFINYLIIKFFNIINLLKNSYNNIKIYLIKAMNKNL